MPDAARAAAIAAAAAAAASASRATDDGVWRGPTTPPRPWWVLGAPGAGAGTTPPTPAPGGEDARPPWAARAAVPAPRSPVTDEVLTNTSGSAPPVAAPSARSTTSPTTAPQPVLPGAVGSGTGGPNAPVGQEGRSAPAARSTGAGRPTGARSAWDGWDDDPLPAPRALAGDPPRRSLRWLAAAVAVALVFAAGLALGARRDAAPVADTATAPALSDLIARSSAGTAGAAGDAAQPGGAPGAAAGAASGGAEAAAPQAPGAQPDTATVPGDPATGDGAQPGQGTGAAAAPVPGDATTAQDAGAAATPAPADVTVQVTEDGNAVVAQTLTPDGGVPARLDLRLGDVGTLLAAGPPQLTSLAVQVDGQPATATPVGDTGREYRVDSAGGTTATVGYELVGVLGPLAGAPTGAVAVVPLLAPATGAAATTVVVRGRGVVDVTCPTPDGATAACGQQEGTTWTATVPADRTVLQVALDLGAG